MPIGAACEKGAGAYEKYMRELAVPACTSLLKLGQLKAQKTAKEFLPSWAG
jgi:hypothetical protein